MKVGFIGTGSFAMQHARILKEIGVDITACFGTNTQKTISFSNEFNAKIISNVEELINKKYVDALYIVIPPFAHNGSIELLAINRQIPFLCEKPIGLDLNICRKIDKEIRQNNLVTSSGFQLRYEKLFESIKPVLSRNKLSTIRICSYSTTAKVAWWRKQECSGGMMVEQTCHYLDLLRYLLGEADSIAAFSSTGLGKKYIADCSIEDSIEAILKFPKNIIVSIGITHLLNNIKARKDLLEFYGINFAMKIDLLKLRHEQKAEAFYKEDGDSEWKMLAHETSRDQLLKQESIAFLTAVEKKDPTLVKSSYSDALKTLELSFAINEAARLEQVIYTKL